MMCPHADNDSSQFVVHERLTPLHVSKQGPLEGRLGEAGGVWWQRFLGDLSEQSQSKGQRSEFRFLLSKI